MDCRVTRVKPGNDDIGKGACHMSESVSTTAAREAVRTAPVSITNIRASIHTTSIAIPLLEGKVAGYGREEQKEFVVCEVETARGAAIETPCAAPENYPEHQPR